MSYIPLVAENKMNDRMTKMVKIRMKYVVYSTGCGKS